MSCQPIKFAAGLLLLVVLGVAGLASCSSTIPRRDVLRESFPQVEGESLDGETVALPNDVGGAPTVLLLGYKQNAQFDLDRWMLGLIQARTPVRVLEVPTIPGMVPGMIAGTIDAGMRSGIPAEDWAAVVTLYGKDAARVARWTGTEDGLNGRIVLLDRDGTAVWFHDRGFSPTKLLELDAMARGL